MPASIRHIDPVTYSNSKSKYILVTDHILISFNITKCLPVTNSIVNQKFPCLLLSVITMCQYYHYRCIIIVAHNFIHPQHYSVSDLFSMFPFSTKSHPARSISRRISIHLQLEFAGIPIVNGVIHLSVN